MKLILFILVQKHLISPGLGTEQQPIYVLLSTDKENAYPKYIKLTAIPIDNGEYISKFTEMKAVLSRNRILNTDGKTTFATLDDKITLKSEKINYDESNHRLKWLNIISGNIKNNITGIYHGIPKRDLPLFLHEQEWRFNHRCIGSNILEKISKYITKSFPMPNNTFTYILNIAEPYFSATSV